MFLYKGHKTNKIRKTDETKEIILWLNHLTADLRHIDNKITKKKTLSRKCLQPFDHFSRTNKGLLNTQTSAVQITFE